MSVEQIVNVPPSHRLVIEVPHEVPAGSVVLTFTSKEASTQERKKTRVFGYARGKGEYWMAEDFDAPLDDFKDYR
ncbi:MAG: DUF2281 domain-containing protein [Treponema sp.]|jgi:hypothetical protein|nr:DUF2281 domain-containing protein [Treponema sp.]